ncbi:MAG: hypothetical protein R3D58_14315 [Saprospiraceae bacterium]
MKHPAVKVLALLFSISICNQAEAQSVILELLYAEAKNVFKGKVERIRYESSNGEGSSFSVHVIVEKMYKGDEPYHAVIFGVEKADVIDVELDTIILDYSFNIIQDSSYLFFANEIRLTSAKEKTGLSRFISEIEGIPVTNNLEQLLEKYDKYTFLETKNTRNYPTSNFALDKMKTNSGTIFSGKVLKIEARQGIGYALKVGTKSGKKTVLSKNTNCVCGEGSIKVGRVYVFYTNKDEANKYRLVDEWLSIIEASEYDKLKY